MANCPNCGAAVDAWAAELMTGLGIVSFAVCPRCGREFLPLAWPDVPLEFRPPGRPPERRFGEGQGGKE
jgi:hypothetical protein